MKEKDNPGIYIPPPLIYAAIFLIALFLQKKASIDDTVFKTRLTMIAGVLFFAAAVFFLSRSLVQFIRTRNSVVTVKPAESLQTSGIYRATRNPMYVGLVLVYLGLTCLIGNWWNIILLPVLLLTIQEYVMKREEKYLTRKFGPEYINYKQKVKRWL
jgi:protein-S-isoprenylcysteine O-methyltransferase Ste14